MRHYGHTDYKWAVGANPANLPWVPGYRFKVKQEASCNSVGATMRRRRYWVFFQINSNGHVEYRGGVSPTDATLVAVNDLYARKRPGSNQ